MGGVYRVAEDLTIVFSGEDREMAFGVDERQVILFVVVDGSPADLGYFELRIAYSSPKIPFL